jgi:N-acetylmuramoyl-L-alanine amidase
MNTPLQSRNHCGEQDSDPVRRRFVRSQSGIFVLLILLLLAGCATPRNAADSRPKDWEAEDAATARVIVPPSPVFEPPPPNLPYAQPKRAHSTEPAEKWVALSRWCKSQGLAAPALITMTPLPSYSLRTPGGGLIIRMGSHIAYWDGMDLRLGYAPHLIDGQPFLHALDLKKSILPLVNPSPLTCLRSNPVIVIDPGHGGENAGTASVLGNHYEKEFTMDWAKRLQRLLLTNGFQVHLTHTNDVDMALSNRVAFAQAREAGLFLSLHFNSAAPDEGEAGLETYSTTPPGMPSTVTRGFADDSAVTFPNNAFDAQNLQLAVRIHREILAVNGHHDRGLRRARFLGVLRSQERPAVLIEGGYLSNPTEASLIATPAYRQKLAAAVTRALIENSEVRVQR